MLSQSEIFNRLPISDEQKAELYKILISERHTELDRLAASSKTPAVPTDHSQAETMAMDESPEELESAQRSLFECGLIRESVWNSERWSTAHPRRHASEFKLVSRIEQSGLC